jgi:antitoxin (DNA-binding transcriptional repressor) of toxin-antitoxin stability system
MKIANIGELRNGLSRFLDYVRAGGRVVIMDRDRPVAEIVPLDRDSSPESQSARLLSLEREGIVKRGSGKLPDAQLTGPLPGKTARVLDALLEERRKSR